MPPITARVTFFARTEINEITAIKPPMTTKPTFIRTGGLPFVRFFMVLTSLSPLFLLWAIRGVDPIPDKIFIPVCLCTILISHIVVWLRFRIVKNQNSKHPFTVGRTEDNRHHILVYLLGILLPFYRGDIDTMREMYAAIAALIVVVFIFVSLNLHYINIGFILLRYRIFAIYPSHKGHNPNSAPIILISRRTTVKEDTTLMVYRISDTVYWETNG